MVLSELEPVELLRQYTAVIDELKNRGIVRTNNAPLGDFTEWLVAKRMNLDLAPNSKAGYDAISDAGVKFQIKGRRVTPSNNSRQLSAIRKYEEADFEYLIAVIFDENFSIIEAYLISHEIVGKYGRFQKHTNALNLIMSGAILDDPGIMKVGELLDL
jgi:hypothetical protein